MLKRLLRDSVIYTLGRVASAVVAVFVLPLYTAYVRPAEFGLFDMGNLVITLALPIANGAATRADFVRHATTVVIGCVAIVAIVLVTGTFVDVSGGSGA